MADVNGGDQPKRSRRRTRDSVEKRVQERTAKLARVNQALQTEIEERSQAEQRLATQYLVAQILAQSATLAEASLSLLETICRSLTWEAGAVWGVSRDDGLLRCIEFWSCPERAVPNFEAVSRERVFAPGVGLPGRVWQNAEPLWIADIVKDDNFPRATVAKSEGLHGAFGFPILAGSDVIGIIEFFSSRIRQPDQDLLNMMGSIGNQIGQVIERRRAEEDLLLSERRLKQQTEVVETINRIGQLLSAELDQQKLVQAVTDAATELTGAQFGSFFYNVTGDRGASYMLYTLSGVPREHFAQFPMPRATDMFGPTFRGEGTIRLDDVKQDPRYGKNSPYYGMPPGHLPVTSYLAVPVVSREGEVLGGLFFGHPRASMFTERHERIVEGLAAQTAIAMDNSRLYEAARRARAQAEDNESHYKFLAEASNLLASSLDYEVTLASVAHLAVPALADWCVVDIVEENHSIKRVAIAHRDPQMIELAHELQRRYPPDTARSEPLAAAIETGRPHLMTDVSDSMLVELARDSFHLDIIRSLGLKSFIVVPMVARNRTLGAISFILAEIDRRYTEQDLAFFQDLAGRAAVAVDNAKLYGEAQEANRAKDEFLATVSHELRTPLNAIMGWARMLRTGQLDEESLAHAYETIERNSKAQAQLINDILDVSRIISGKLRLEVLPVELDQLIRGAVESLRPAADARGVGVRMLMDWSAGPVAGDAERLQQVVWNLLSNAIKFTPEGGQVEVRMERVNSHVEIAVSDTGRGVSPEFLPHVFERFRQADSSTTRQHGGLGLGLAIVRHLVELHGGTVRAESPGEDRGATFTVRLPVMPGCVRQAGADEMRSGDEPDLTVECLPHLDGLKILIVDDEEDTRELLKAMLSPCGAEVKAAQSATEALDEVRRWRPDVVVSDIEMPGEDGYTLIRKVRALAPEEGGRVPAIALTAYARSEDRIRALVSGYQMHVPKPVEMTELALAIASLAGRTGGV
jgi:signal transduction histidine kinase/ActR/RegA family two-component response regulator